MSKRDELRYLGPKPDLVIIAPPFATDDQIQKFVSDLLPPDTRWGNSGEKGVLPVWCAPSLPANEIYLRCARQDDISGEFGRVYER